MIRVCTHLLKSKSRDKAKLKYVKTSRVDFSIFNEAAKKWQIEVSLGTKPLIPNDQPKI